MFRHGSKLTSENKWRLEMVVEVDADENECLHLVPGGQRYRYPRPGPRHCRKAEQRGFPF